MVMEPVCLLLIALGAPCAGAKASSLFNISCSSTIRVSLLTGAMDFISGTTTDALSSSYRCDLTHSGRDAIERSALKRDDGLSARYV